MKGVTLETRLCGLRLRNPFILASGVMGTTAGLLVRAGKEGAGAVTTKSCSLIPREGHPNPAVIEVNEWVTINAVGLSNPGVDWMVKEIRDAVKHAGVPVIASIFGNNVDEYGEAAERISEAKPSAIEVNISCPNVQGEGRMFAASEEDARKITGLVKDRTRLPVFVKLSPNVTDIKRIAIAVEEGGADGITAINTVGGMLIDPVARKPILSNVFGGMSGKCIFPVALKAVYEISRSVDIPIIGMGGVSSGIDAAEMIMTGATAVGVGTAATEKNAFRRMTNELAEFMRKNGYGKISELKLEE